MENIWTLMDFKTTLTNNIKRHRRGTYVHKYIVCTSFYGDRGGTVVKVLCYKSEDRWFDSGWCHWNFSLT